MLKNKLDSDGRRQMAEVPLRVPKLDRRLQVEVKPDATAEPRELQDFLARKLADFKVPKQIVITDRIDYLGGGMNNLPYVLAVAAGAAMAEPTAKASIDSRLEESP